MENNSIAERLTQKIEEQITELPNQIYEAILQEVSGDSPVGAALRENNGDTLKGVISRLSTDDMPRFAERMVNLNLALPDSTMVHTPDLTGLLAIADAAAGQVDPEADDAAHQWYQSLRTVASTIPGRDHLGNVVSRYQLYANEAEENPYDVVAAAKQALGDPNTPAEEMEYWQQIARDNVPELATHTGEINAAMIPESNAQDLADGQNDSLGKAAGLMMNAVTGSSQPQKAEDSSDQSFLTDRSVGEEWRNLISGDDSDTDDADDGDDLALGAV